MSGRSPALAESADEGPAPLPPARLPFSWVGGDRSVDLVNTVSWGSRGLAQERLRGYDDVVDWAEQAGIVTRPALLRRAAAHDPAAATAALTAALELRAHLRELFAARASGARPPVRAVATLDRWAVEAAGHRRLRLEGDGLSWTWTDDADLHAPLRRVAAGAAMLLTAGEGAHVKLCGNSECGWVFLDRSRRGNRRWCEMTACGSRDKARRYYRRQRAAEAEGGQP